MVRVSTENDEIKDIGNRLACSSNLIKEDIDGNQHLDKKVHVKTRHPLQERVRVNMRM